MPRKSLREFVREHAEVLRCYVYKQARNARPQSLRDLEEWVMNDEGLYNWARSEGVRI